MIGGIFSDSVTPFEETLFDADPELDLHVMVATLGGDGETALRLVRQAQSRCRTLTVIVPDQAKSAGTLFALGADRILMGPTSDLGPIDPQFRFPNGTLAAAKTIIAAVDDAERRIQASPETYPLHASLLNDVTALLVQQARDEIARTGDQLREALASATTRNQEAVDALVEELQGPLIDNTQSHRAVISSQEASAFGLPVEVVQSSNPQWQAVWRMWTKYVALNPTNIFSNTNLRRANLFVHRHAVIVARLLRC